MTRTRFNEAAANRCGIPLATGTTIDSILMLQ